MHPVSVCVYSETIAPGVTLPVCQAIIASCLCAVYSASTAIEELAIFS